MRIEIELSVNERYALMTILPTKDSYDTLMVVTALKERLSVTEDEKTLIGWKEHPNGSATWNDANEGAKSIIFVEAEVNLFKKQFEILDKEGALHINLLGLYKNFVLEKDVKVLPNV